MKEGERAVSEDDDFLSAYVDYLTYMSEEVA